MQFCDLTLNTPVGVCQPVSEMEEMVAHILDLIGDQRNYPIRILDLGTGTGCLLLALLKACPNATGIGVDIDAKALTLAQENAKENDLDDRAAFLKSNWCDAVDEPFDFVISNPPAAPTSMLPDLPEPLKKEPLIAVHGGVDGLDFFRMMAKELIYVVKPSGQAVFHVHHLNREADLFRRRGFPVETLLNSRREPCCIVVKNDPVTPWWYKFLRLFFR